MLSIAIWLGTQISDRTVNQVTWPVGTTDLTLQMAEPLPDISVGVPLQAEMLSVKICALIAVSSTPILHLDLIPSG